ncbi:aldehyde dehydrogenase family protein [Mycolicibacterium sphagni]|uniref:Aldehyde dehydrogenase family protein n=1 Tax=Mycolicibacterium sphagni TaxID=1786 RepID=A0ABX2JN19_9MYCO|nr:aldehyde dehydrogenase family protein [Mycolicibacterium sphagni]
MIADDLLLIDGEWVSSLGNGVRSVISLHTQEPTPPCPTPRRPVSMQLSTLRVSRSIPHCGRGWIRRGALPAAALGRTSTAAGQHQARACADQLKPVRLELGGKSAAIVLDDADPTAVAARVRSGSFGINEGYTMDPYARYGGIRAGGYRREPGRERVRRIPRNAVDFVGRSAGPIVDVAMRINGAARHAGKGRPHV